MVGKKIAYEKREDESFSKHFPPIIYIFIFIAFYAFVVYTLFKNKANVKDLLIIISLDGFRHDYIEMTKRHYGQGILPGFDRIAGAGVRARQLMNVFPTSTLPTHQTILTGLYPQHHGVTANTMYDTRYPTHLLSMINDTSLVEDPWLDGWPEPIWVTAQRHGALVGAHLWPITERPIKGDLPFQRVARFKQNAEGCCFYPNRRRIDDILQWITSPYYKLKLILAYFSEIDIMGHLHGPNSLETADSIVRFDTLLGYFLNKLETLDLTNRVNLILLSDHGMTEISKRRLIVLNDLVDPGWYTVSQLGSLGYVYPISGKLEDVYSILKGAHPRLSVYKLHEVPTDYNFSVPGVRMPPVLLVADLGWYMVRERPDSFKTTAGQHGYPPMHSDMHGFFMASGPAFPKGLEVPHVYTIDLYALICRLLGLPANPHNGSLQRISQIIWPGIPRR